MSPFEFRSAVLDEIDDAYDERGETPDHIILSKETYDWLEQRSRFETLADKSNPKRPGYIGMRVWYSRALDERDKMALLISDEVFEHIVTRAEDYKCGEPFTAFE